jgi:hypothetical protein
MAVGGRPPNAYHLDRGNGSGLVSKPVRRSRVMYRKSYEEVMTVLEDVEDITPDLKRYEEYQHSRVQELKDAHYDVEDIDATTPLNFH